MWSGGQPGPARPGAPGAAPAAAGQEGQLDEYKKSQAENKKEEQVDGADKTKQEIAEIEAGERDGANNYDTEVRQLDAEAEKIRASVDQLKFSQEKQDELIRKAQDMARNAGELRQRYIFDQARWLWLSKNDIIQTVASANEESLFAYMQATSNLTRATWGGGGQARGASGRSVRLMATDMPSDATARSYEMNANEQNTAVRESQIGLDAQADQIRSSEEQIASHRGDLARKYEDQQESLADKKRRAEERLAEINTKIEETSRKIEEGAAAMASGKKSAT